MSKLMEALKARFEPKRAQLHRIDVPGLSEPIFVRPMTQEERMKIYEKGIGGFEAQVRSILIRALKEDGTPALGLQYRLELMKYVSTADIDYISDKMAEIELSVADAEKKSEGTQS